MADKICILLLAVCCLIQTAWIWKVQKKLDELVEDWEGEDE